MPIKYRCNHCRKKISVSSRHAGKRAKCPQCGNETVVPAMEMLRRSDKPYRPEKYFEPAAEDVPAFQVRRRGSEEDDMDLTPMVDVTFLLLIFFILTASLSLQKAIAVPPPDPQQEGAQSTPISLEELEADSIVVEIQADNTIIVDDETLPPEGDLARMLEQSMTSSGRREMVINAHANSFHETTVAVFDAANEVGMQRIRMVTTSDDD